ncbi:hypothetical protein P775_11975 [Puniceibacterium antarcticum]|uniref:Uncharacterized protein n=1 Tax=Puniceibacterium antarcticum TaxID=1206336 RepID=A0A2G8REH0_9RHOB|nr:hypothetical protein P775_11975 [Puniceibacterium antarcticum]
MNWSMPSGRHHLTFHHFYGFGKSWQSAPERSFDDALFIQKGSRQI